MSNMDLRTIARALGGEVTGRQALVPGPGHSRHDRSLAICLSASAPDGFLVHSHAGDDWMECRDYIRQKLGMQPWEPGDEQGRTIPEQHVAKWDFATTEAEANDMIRTEDDLVRINRAQKIWNEASKKPEQPALDYLASRALDPPMDLFGPVLRFHPRTPWRNEDTGVTERIPCLIAAFRSIHDDEITGIHRIRLDRPEHWPKVDRRMLGICAHAAVKLGPVGPKLTIGEGIETSLAAMQMGYGPAWALGSKSAITFFPVIGEVRELKILEEPENRNELRICGKRWMKARRKVIALKSLVGSDANDALMAQRKKQ
jgi:hypothetical protein